jgi:single stranded DNA-binding protein
MSVTNKAFLIGRLGKDPERGTTKNNQPKATFSLGVGRLGAAKDTTDWFFVSMYGKQAETALNMLRKGLLVAIEGSIETWKKSDSSTGFGIACASWQVLEPRKGGSRAGDAEAERQDERERASSAQEDEDEYPF